jgi:hypothetical protein
MSNGFPYDSGNAGDLIKHEWLLRVLDWLPAGGRFFDAFAGPPKHALNPRVRDRLAAAPAELRLRIAQEEEMKKGYYLGSALLGKNALRSEGSIQVFDTNTDYVPWYEDCLSIPFEQTLTDGWNSLTLGTTEKREKTLVLIDPYNFFRPNPKQQATHSKNQNIVNNNWSLIQNYPGPLLIFILNLDPNNSIGKTYVKTLTNLKKRYTVFHTVVPPLQGTGIKGEGKYYVELLYLPGKNIDKKEQLWRDNSLKRGAEAVAQTLKLHFKILNDPSYTQNIVEYIKLVER